MDIEGFIAVQTKDPVQMYFSINEYKECETGEATAQSFKGSTVYLNCWISQTSEKRLSSGN